MGGNMTAVGNVSPTVDPEAAHIVLTNGKNPITIMQWENALEHIIPFV